METGHPGIHGRHALNSVGLVNELDHAVATILSQKATELIALDQSQKRSFATEVATVEIRFKNAH